VVVCELPQCRRGVCGGARSAVLCCLQMSGVHAGAGRNQFACICMPPEQMLDALERANQQQQEQQ
jgi:hypothetical protein